jgi:folate-binding Fe-S cluster repair protein YgfZ
MVDFGGWDMPVEYPGPGGGLIAEHLAVRTGVGLFDVSHMGEIQFRGPGALAAVQHITMNDASRLKDGQAHYSALLTPEGTFVDDILVHRLSPNDYLLVVNAGTKDKDYAWIRQQVGSWPSIHISDYSALLLAARPARARARLRPCKTHQGRSRRHQELLVHLGHGRRHSQRADRPHRLLRRRRLRSLSPRRRAHHREDVERAARSRRRSSASAPAAWARATPCASKPA